MNQVEIEQTFNIPQFNIPRKFDAMGFPHNRDVFEKIVSSNMKTLGEKYFTGLVYPLSMIAHYINGNGKKNISAFLFWLHLDRSYEFLKKYR